MKLRTVLSATLALLGTSAAYSAPTVEGQVISWPDDGWYQVQNANTYQEMCAGGRSCEVAPGTYNVINHSTGQRFTNIVVTSGSTPESAIVITGNVISWPNDGWYQVQSADTYEKYCGGARSCEVAPGTYIVINLTTGKRYTGIKVTTDGGGGGNTALAAPSNLRLTAYSATSAELFWDRANTPGLQYEISRNGTLMTTSNGTSYYDGALQDDRDYTYSVIAVDTAGNRSEAAEVALEASTPGTGTGTGTTTDPLYPETDKTPSPKDITLAVYSDSTAELTWVKPAYSYRITTNEILRDNELIATISGNGSSYVDSTRMPNTAYRYEIVAINQYGKASSVFLDVGNPSGGGEPIDGSGLPAELAVKLDATFNLISATPIGKVAATVLKLEDPTAHGLQLVATVPHESGLNRLEYACPQGGSWFDVARLENNDYDYHEFQGVDCVIGSITLSGNGKLSGDQVGGPITWNRVNLDNIVLQDSRDNSRIEIGYSNSNYDDNLIGESVYVRDLSVTSPEGNYQAEIFNLNVNESAAIEITAENVTGALTDLARIRSREKLLLGDNGYPMSGAVSVFQVGTNSESYDIAAGNGNPDTFTFTATDEGVTTAYEIDWSEKRYIGDLDLTTVDVGF